MDSSMTPVIPSQPIKATRGFNASHAAASAFPVRKWHPQCPWMLHIGTSGNDSTDVWAALSDRIFEIQKGRSQVHFYDKAMNRVSEDSLNIIFKNEFRYENFPGGDSQTGFGIRKRLQRQYIGEIIQERTDALDSNYHHYHRDAGIGATVNPTSRKPEKRASVTEKRDIVVLSDDEESNVNDVPSKHSKRSGSASVSTDLSTLHVTQRPLKRESTQSGLQNIQTGTVTPPPQPRKPMILAPADVERTSLLVSTSHLPNRAPSNIPLVACTTPQRLFFTLAAACSLQREASLQLNEVSVTFPWNNKRLLVHKGWPRDWDLFVKAICKGWESHRGIFEKDDEGCEIVIMAHIIS